MIRFRIHLNPDHEVEPDIDKWELCVYDADGIPACVVSTNDWDFLVDVLNHETDQATQDNVLSAVRCYHPQGV